MKNYSYISMQQDMPDQGQLQVTVLDSASNRPVENATVHIPGRTLRSLLASLISTGKVRVFGSTVGYTRLI